MKTIDFTDEEINALCALLDIAVKAGGINVAEAAVFLTKKLRGVQGPMDPGAPQEVLSN
jgi:hypothetical protein